MPNALSVFLIIYFIFSIIYLVSLFLKQGTFQAVAKGCLMPLLLAVYISAADETFLPVMLALVFSCAGDIFLLQIEKLLFFRLGLASFLFGHICYIIALLYFALPLNITVLLISIAGAIVFEVVMYKVVHPNKEMRIPVIVYETVIVVMAVLAIQVFLVRGSPFGAFILAGSICFLVSDSILARFTFGKKPRYGDFLVMLSYLCAQTCLVLGFIGLT